MDNSQPLAITAIADGAQESFIASLLAKFGFQIIHRATTTSGLAELLAKNPTVLLVASDDFRAISEVGTGDLLLIRGKSTGSGPRSTNDPRTEVEFSDLLNSRRESQGSNLIRPTRSSARVTLFFSIGNARGATSAAINCADVLIHQGADVLLIDANLSHLDMSDRFQMNALYKKEQQTQFGFSICEINSFESLEKFAAVSNSFTEVLVDCGRFQDRFLKAPGRRLEDFLYLWAAQSATNTLLLVSETGITKALSAHRDIATINSASKSRLIISLDGAKGAREREKFASRISSESGLSTHLLSRDSRAIEKMEREGSTIAATSPRSPLKGEITALALSLLKG